MTAWTIFCLPLKGYRKLTVVVLYLELLNGICSFIHCSCAVCCLMDYVAYAMEALKGNKFRPFRNYFYLYFAPFACCVMCLDAPWTLAPELKGREEVVSGCCTPQSLKELFTNVMLFFIHLFLDLINTDMVYFMVFLMFALSKFHSVFM